MATSAAARVSPWERAMPIKTQMATTQAHFTKLTDERLTRMRWRRASRADSQRDRHLTLCDPLALAAGRQSQREL